MAPSGFRRAFRSPSAMVVGLLMVVASLLVLLLFQYNWLRHVERVSAFAYRATLHGYLDAVSAEVEFYYRGVAERMLEVPADLFVDGRTDQIATRWGSEPVAGVRQLFLVDYTRDPYGNILVYDRAQGRLLSPFASDETMAIIVACSTWQLMGIRGVPIHHIGMRVDERDPQYRIIFRPIVDGSSQLVGAAGLILDEDYLERTLIPQIVDHVLPAGETESTFCLVASDPAGRIAFQSCDDRDLRDNGPPPSDPARSTKEGGRVAGSAGLLGTKDAPVVGSMNLAFVFTDWTLTLLRIGASPTEWARANLRFNLVLSIVISGVLLGGVVLAARAANRSVRLSRMKSDFVSNVSHELRTPIASIRVFAELLRAGKIQSSEKVLEYGERIEDEATRLTRLLDKILDFSRIESGRKIYRFEPTDLAQLVGQRVERFRQRPEVAEFSVQLMDAPTFDPISLDADAIGLALDNLLENATKYSGESRTIVVQVKQERSRVGVLVIDQGRGIARSEQERIFDRFHRVDQGDVHDVKGTGLGLSIVEHVVHAHGGSVTVESRLGKGSTFTLWLPRRPNETGGTA
ncbi:MAG: HAMP domain-containing histidine kinase [Candidatus Eisenbacteria bacterium]|uniref:histidine kinase n=1 Tax=Eiseniibacteriota bacterium TaxID=2212470 RepID=A0A956LV89_UNCEI|nr:HAMP domain-containing histidine kinase [Candidatus Eisenbacteria bacterium]